jgi:hypothetical protein
MYGLEENGHAPAVKNGVVGRQEAGEPVLSLSNKVDSEQGAGGKVKPSVTVFGLQMK